MAIEYRAPGEAKLIGTLAQKAGEAQAAREAAQQAAERSKMLLQMQAEREARAQQAQQEVALTKMRQDADLQRQAFDEQMRSAAEQTARQWELQKMQISSQNDFALREREYQLKTQYEQDRQLQRKAKFDQQMDYLNSQEATTKLGDPNDPKNAPFYESARQALWAEYADVAPQLMKSPTVKDNSLAQQRLRNQEVQNALRYIGQFQEKKSGKLTYTKGSERRPASEFETEQYKLMKQKVQTAQQFGGTAMALSGPTAPVAAPVYKRNKVTGDVAVSYDGGATWQLQ